MKKLLMIVVLGLLWCNVGFAAKTKLKCQGVLGQVFNQFMYINFDENFIEVVQGSGGNKVKFTVKEYDEYFITSHARVLEKGYIGSFNGDNYKYDTYITDWTEWYSEELKKSLWYVKINRMEGLVGIGVTLEPYAKGVKKTYNLEEAYAMECKKRGLSKF
jgi:hypothetical protein